MVAHTYNLSTWDAEAGGLPWALSLSQTCTHAHKCTHIHINNKTWFLLLPKPLTWLLWSTQLVNLDIRESSVSSCASPVPWKILSCAEAALQLFLQDPSPELLTPSPPYQSREAHACLQSPPVPLLHPRRCMSNENIYPVKSDLQPSG